MNNGIETGPSKTFTAPLQQFTSQDLELAGGKGANLGELIQTGFHVPAGFVVATKAYSCFITENHLSAAIEALREGVDGGDISDRFESSPIPTEIQQDILQAYQQLGQGAVAVRSSATAEDLPEAAFAGQQDTYLNIIGDQQLLEAVRRCWGSLWSERAIAYRFQQGIDQQTVRLAVVVQKMVAAETAGVMFTANPVSGARDEIVIDANPGLGEAVVSGLATPDHFVLQVKKNNRLEITERHPGRREVVIQALPGGGTRQIEGSTADDVLSISDPMLIKLARTGLKIQRHFGRPQDIEWAVSEGSLYILQARPITALPEPLPPSNRLMRMLASIFAEMFPIRPYPLDQTTWVRAISTAAVDPIFGLVGLAVPSIQQFFIEEDGVVVRFSGKLDIHPTLALLLAPARLLLLSLRYDPLHFSSDPLLLAARQKANRLETLDLQAMSWPDLLTAAEQALSLTLPLAGEIRQRYYPRALLSMGMLRVALDVIGQGKLFGDLITAPESATVQANQALEALAAQVRSDPELARIFRNTPPDQLEEVLSRQPAGLAFLDEFQDFLARYGHREVILSSALEPTWKDAPEVVLGIITGLAQTEPVKIQRADRWEIARDRLLAHPLMRLAVVRRWMLRLVARARSLWQIREDTHFDATRILPILRRIFLELGQRLVGIDVLSSPEEVFHLKWEDLQRIDGTWPLNPELASELKSLVQLRKQKRLALEKIPVIDPRLYQPTHSDREALLTGTPGSPGMAEGPVRIIHSAAEFSRLQSGDILVAPYTNPAWTPLFQRAAAIIADGGAAGSHAAIVAREYGLPAVVGTVDGTRRLVDGQLVRVDGSRGLVLAVRDTAGEKENKENAK